MEDYLSLVYNFSYGTDHAGSAGTKHPSDPLLLHGGAQLSHGNVTLRHPQVFLRGQNKNDNKFLNNTFIFLFHLFYLYIFLFTSLLTYLFIFFCILGSHGTDPFSGYIQDTLSGHPRKNDSIQRRRCKFFL